MADELGSFIFFYLIFNLLGGFLLEEVYLQGGKNVSIMVVNFFVHLKFYFRVFVFLLNPLMSRGKKRSYMLKSAVQS